MSIAAGYNGSLLISSPPSLNLAANFALQDSGDHQTFQVSAANAAYRYWDRTSTFTFQTSPDGATWTTVAPQLVTYVGGKVKFAAPVTGATPSARVTAGKYFPYITLGYVKEWSWDGTWNFDDSTVLSGNGSGAGGSRAMTQQPTTFNGMFKAKRFWLEEDALTMANLITQATLLVVSCVAPGGARYEAYCYAGKSSIAGSPDKLITNDLEFPIDGLIAIN